MSARKPFKKNTTKGKQQQEIKYNYLKSQSYRNIHADGFFGGVTPTGNIHLSAFSERHPIPKIIHHSLEAQVEGAYRLGNELLDKREVLEGSIRELEIGIYFDVRAARALRIWLDEKIQTIEGRLKFIEKESKQRRDH